MRRSITIAVLALVAGACGGGESTGDDGTAASTTVAAVADTRTEACAPVDSVGIAYETPGPHGVLVECDIVYKSVDGLDQTLRVYTPADLEDGALLPTVIFVNGNGTDEGPYGPLWPTSREQPIEDRWQGLLAGHAELAASYGMAGVTFDYGSFPMGGPFGDRNEANTGLSMQDGLDLLGYLDAHAAELHVDPTNACVWTFSTGSMLGGYLALAASPQPKCAVVFTGPLDWEDAGKYNPTSLVSSDMPPFFIARASADIATNPRIDRFVSAVKAADATDQVIVERVSSVQSFEVREPDAPTTQQAIESALDFLMEHLSVGT